MTFRSLKRNFQDLARLRHIVTILVERGFHELVAKAKLSRHADLSARVIASHEETTPQRVRETLEALGPTFVKLGQLLSLRPDRVPQAYCDEFRKLQDDVAPLSFPVIKGVVEAELKLPLVKLFKNFDREPLAAASVSQVHEATLLDGTHVVVKVQRPGVADVMAHDIDIMGYIAGQIDRVYKEIHAREIVEEFKEYTERELNFTVELRNVNRFHSFFARNPEVLIPATFEELSTRRILVLERLKGIRVSDMAALRRAKVETKALAAIGFRSMLRQVFELGAFHADPHPGNLLAVQKGKRWALAFLDFGIVGYLDDELQRRFLDLLNALVERDTRGATRTILRIGERGKGFDEKGLEREISSLIMEWHGSTLREKRMSSLLHHILTASIDHHLMMPPNIILVAKAFVTIEGTGAWLDPDFNITSEAAPFLKRLYRQRFSPANVTQELLRGAAEFSELAHEIPTATEMLLDKVKEGKVELTIDKKEFKWVARDYDLETSKRNLALISAAFLVGSALMAGLAPELTFLGWPLYDWGFGCFLLTLVFLIYVSFKIHKYLERID
jgi:ubiquinone biosynthesis protein